jgi:hypothetical protein
MMIHKRPNPIANFTASTMGKSKAPCHLLANPFALALIAGALPYTPGKGHIAMFCLFKKKSRVLLENSTEEEY